MQSNRDGVQMKKWTFRYVDGGIVEIMRHSERRELINVHDSYAFQNIAERLRGFRGSWSEKDIKRICELFWEVAS